MGGHRSGATFNGPVMPFSLSRAVILAPVILITTSLFAGRSTAFAQAPPGSATAPAGDSGRLAGAGAERGAQPIDWSGGGDASRASRQAAVSAIPFSRLTPAAQQRITAITNRPTLYRHLSQQSIQCDPELFLFVVRHPEVLVGIWELMDITEVKTERVGDFQLRAVDGSGTECTVDLVYGDATTHVYVADGFYDGKLTPNAVHGKGVFLLRCQHGVDVQGNPIVEGTLDCFVQVDHLAADLIVRTFGPLIGRTAENNFAETARFIDQLGQSARNNPTGMEELAMRLPQVSEGVRTQFAGVVRQTAARHHVRAMDRRPTVSRASLPAASAASAAASATR